MKNLWHIHKMKYYATVKMNADSIIQINCKYSVGWKKSKFKSQSKQTLKPGATMFIDSYRRWKMLYNINGKDINFRIIIICEEEDEGMKFGRIKNALGA